MNFVVVEENSNFHCIVCNAEFLSRTERNEHLETHFVHRNCMHCTRPVIVIGDLEFELHQPTYCKQIEPIISTDDIKEDEEIIYDEIPPNQTDIDDEKCSEIDLDCKPKRIRSKINYNEQTTEIENLSIVKRERPPRKGKRKNTKRSAKPEHIDVENGYESNLNENSIDSYLEQKADTESEDDVIKEMDVAIKKRRKQYAKLPKTVPCTMCDDMFGTERTLKIHMHQVHGVKEKYICPICSREFKIGGNLKQHIETHSDYKRFICNYCGKGFHLPYNLKEHMNVHTGAR